MVKAFVGAGGKTSLMKAYARMYRAQGLKVLMTTTTRMFIEEDTLLTGDAEVISRRLEETGMVMAGLPCGEKFGPLPQETYEAACRCADVVLVEADGSKHLPVKFPGADEPVIPGNAEEIIVVCGLHALGRRLGEAAHRPELAAACLGVGPDETITPAHIQKLVEEGYLKPLRERYPRAQVRVCARHDGSLFQRALAGLLEAEMDVNLIREEWFAPQPVMVICGGGHVAGELARMADMTGFRVHVIDDREEFANRERFPFAEEVICDSFENMENHLVPGAYYVVVTRGHSGDFDCMKAILGTPARYTGMIGSRTKVARTMEKLGKEGFSPEVLQKVFAPIGLDIGAVTPAEIAVSILAEIIREKNRHCSGFVSRELLESREKGVLCLITHKRGSSPRGVGSMMLVGRGRIYDSIGGGAVEQAAIDEARSLSCAVEKEYSLDRREGGDLGMICGGSNRVLFIPLPE